MREPAIIEEVRQRLLRKGFGRIYADRTAGELRDHWSDLVEEGLRQGLSVAEAQAEADQRMGEGAALAEQLAARMRRSSWLGRNPTLGFAALSLLAVLVWWAVWLLPIGAIAGLFRWNPKVSGSAEPAVDLARMGAIWIRATSLVAAPWIICLVARRYYCGWQAALWGCLTVAIHNGLHFFRISGDGKGGTVAWGYGFSMKGPELLPLIAPICVFALCMLWNARRAPERRYSNL